MQKRIAWVCLCVSMVLAACFLPFLCAHCAMTPETATAYYEKKARQDAAGDDAQAQLMALLLGQSAQTEEPEISDLPAFEFHGYGQALAVGAVLSAAITLIWARKKQGITNGLLWGLALALPMGLIGARLFYCLSDLGFYLWDIESPSAMLKIWEGGLSLAGALFFAALAGTLGAKLGGCPAGQTLDAMTPGLLIFAAYARAFERMIGAGWGPAVSFSLPLLTCTVHDTVRLNTALVMLLVILVILGAVWRARRPFATAALLYGGVMILMESLRRDGHMLWGFVHAEMVCALVMTLPAMLYFAGNKKRILVALFATVLLAGAVIGLEFALDRSNVPDLILYALYAAALALWLGLGLWMKKRRAA